MENSTVSRRVFLVAATATAHGLLIGAAGCASPSSNGTVSPETASPGLRTHWVRIDSSGTTLITPRADVGQGAQSIQAALIAEELDLNWDAFQTEVGLPDSAYWNGRILAENLPVAATSDGFFAAIARGAGSSLGRVLGLQITGGSSTVPDAFDRLRVAGAVARRMLLQAASAKTGVPIEQLRTAEGQVLLPTGEHIPYTVLAPLAATQVVPNDVSLRPSSEWRLLGKRMQRLDMKDKCAGRAPYGIDLRLPGLLHATVRTSPAGTRLKRFDATQALRRRGVIEVVPIPNGFGVIADNTWRAFEAARSVEVEWETLVEPLSTEAIYSKINASFSSRSKDSRLLNRGRFDSRWQNASAQERIEAEYRLPPLAHAPLEPMNATARLLDGWLDVWTGTQIPKIAVAAASKTSGIPENRIRLHAMMSGGSFGRRLEYDYIDQAVRLAVSRPGVPIQMLWSREEDMTHDIPRPPAIGRARGCFTPGKVDSVDLAVAMPSVGASQGGRWGLPVIGPDVTIVAGAWDQPLEVPNYRVTGYKVSGLMPVSSWRSVGASCNGFIHESFLDELIHAAGVDPLAERLRLCKHALSRKVLERIGELSNWQSPLPGSPDGQRGRGVAFVLSFGVPTAQVVEVTATSRGIRIDKVFVVAAVGRVLDPVNFENQVQGGVVWGLGHAIHAELTYQDGAVTQTNFHTYESMRMYQVPKIVVEAVEAGRVTGMGEPSVPPAAPALANAIFAATGRRIRDLPLRRQIDFV